MTNQEIQNCIENKIQLYYNGELIVREPHTGAIWLHTNIWQIEIGKKFFLAKTEEISR